MSSSISDFYLQEKAKVMTLFEDVTIFCDTCDQEAFIFQVEGNFCLNCWQEKTEPHITKWIQIGLKLDFIASGYMNLGSEILVVFSKKIFANSKH